MAAESPSPRGPVNVNVGVLGHVDSGKTRLVRVLSTLLSTAALDKHPQSQQRGMTLDLGFSAFRLPSVPNGPELQITLVDCPGHASLFKTILGAVHIIDAVLLVVDVQKGLQPQTIECLLLAELAVSAQIVVALNKIDLVPDTDRAARVSQVQREIQDFLSRNFKNLGAKTVPVVPVAAAPAALEGGELASAIGIADLVETIRAALPVPKRYGSGPLCFAIDHCFAIQGNGTILTGTVLSGSVALGDEIELPGLQLTKKVKSMQVFKRNVESTTQGDRVAMRVNGLDASLVERGMATTPKSLPFVEQVIIRVNQIPFFEGKCKSGGKIHVTVGHTTVLAVATFFASHFDGDDTPFQLSTVYRAVGEVESVAKDQANAVREQRFHGFALLQFEQPVICPPKAVVVCSRFDLDPKKFHCRLAFHGSVEAVVWGDDDVKSENHFLVAAQSLRSSEIKIGTIRERSGVVDKPIMKGDSVTEVLARDMFAKDVDWDVYAGTTVLLERSKRLGTILGPFGKSGKFRIELIQTSNPCHPAPGEKVVLRFIKLATLRPLRRPGDSGSARKDVNHNGKIKKGTRNLLQDTRILYPQAFETSIHPDTKVSEVESQAPSLPSSEPRITATGRIERLKGETTADGRNPFVIVSGLFEDEPSASAASGRPVRCLLSKSPGVTETGQIEKPFGKAGKVRVVFSDLGGTLGQVGDIIELL